MDKKEIKRKSKFLSFILRHRPEVAGLNLDKNGWADIDELIEKVWENSDEEQFCRDSLEEIVRTNDKQRFEFNDDKTKIRASQGHSVKVDLDLEPKDPPDYLFHGTTDRFLESIKEKGLIKGNRQHVHLSSDFDTAVRVGQRHGKPLVLLVYASRMQQEGHKFFLSNNGVWLTDNVPSNCMDYDVTKEESERKINVRKEWKREEEEKYAKGDVLLKNIKDNMPELEKLLETSTGHWYEDRMYRFYHHSFKVYDLVETTEEIVKALRKISPHEKDELFDPYFERIILEGTCQNRKWEVSHNVIFDTVARPFIEAFLHCKYFIEMAVKYGKELKESPNCLPSGWSALLELYNIR